MCRLLELAKRVFRLVPGLEGCVILADEGLISCHRVEGVEEKVLVAQKKVLMLRVDVDEFAAHLAQHAKCGRSVVDEGATFSGCRHFSAHDDGAVFEVDVSRLQQFFHGQSSDVKSAFDNALLGTAFDGFGIGAIALQQSECTENDTLTRTCFTRNHAHSSL